MANALQIRTTMNYAYCFMRQACSPKGLMAESGSCVSDKFFIVQIQT
jgi:hypothetical protein